MDIDFSSVRLKKTVGGTRDGSVVRIEETICKDDEDYARLMNETRLEEYLSVLGDELTFPTIVLPMNQSQQDLRRCFREKRSWKEFPSLVQLARTIDEQKPWELIFVRLSTRSPKDAALKMRRYPELVRAHYERVVKENGEESQNERLMALAAAATEVMGCRSGEECLDLLAASERIQDDLENMSSLQICIREFVYFDSALESRGFVWEGKLTALTQYNNFVVSKKLLSMKHQVEAACIKCFNELIGPKLEGRLKRYSIDFVVTTDLRVYVVEINPLAEFTGMGLFSWGKDRDIITGKQAFEYRVATEVDSIVDISSDYRAMLNAFDSMMK